MRIASWLTDYLCDEGSQKDGTEDGVVEDALKDVPLTMNLAGIELIKDLHQDERVEHDGVVLGGWSMEGGVPATVNVQQLLTYGREDQRLLSRYVEIKTKFIYILIMMDL